MDDLISRQALYERAATLEAQALNYVGKLIERDGDEPSTEWRVWSAILTERTAFKHDVFDAPSVQPERKKGTWEEIYDANENGEPYPCGAACSECGFLTNIETDFCPNCGSYNRGEQDG